MQLDKMYTSDMENVSEIFQKEIKHKTRKSKLYDYSCICVWLHVLSLDLSGIILKEERVYQEVDII